MTNQLYPENATVSKAEGTAQSDLLHQDKILKETPEEKAYDYILKGIVTKKFFPGNQLVEMTIADETGVSRTPVRAAIKKLNYQGIVTLKPNKGAFISFPQKDEISDAYTCKSILECEAVRLACDGISKDSIEKLEELVELEAKLRKEKRFADFLAMNKEFHLIIAKASGNIFLTKYISELMDKCNVYLIFYDRFNDTSNEKSSTYCAHKSLIEALKTKNSKAAVEIMKQHNQRTLEELNLS